MHTTSAIIRQLYDIRNKYGESVKNEKLQLIAQLSIRPRFAKTLLKRYSDVLLFIQAYPDDAAMEQLAAQELRRVAGMLPDDQREARGMFSFGLTKWLRAAYGSLVQPDLMVADPKKCIAVLTCIMGEVATEILQEGYIRWGDWLNQYRHNEQDDLLDVLLRYFDTAQLPPRIKDELWNDMNIVITVQLADDLPTPAGNTGIITAHRCHTVISKNVVMAEVLQHKPRELRITDAQKQHLVALARMVLACNERETEPITHTQPRYCRCYDQGNGLTILLSGLPPGRRQPIDTYIGYMAFKNGLPIAYGGGWILFDSCRIGVNVFPAYRGGESSLIFAQIIGLYKHVFRLNRFTVDPYQVGKNNSEGIQSGAFWMYYRLGFRPTTEHMRALAHNEFEQITTHRPYRSPAGVLKKLADSKPELFTGSKQRAVQFDAADLSAVSLRLLQNTWGGDMQRMKKAIHTQAAHIKNSEDRRLAESWMMVLGPAQWQQLDMHQLLHLKASGDEWDYVRLLQEQEELREIVSGLMQ